MRPIQKYVSDFLASRRLMGEDVQLAGMLEADRLLQQLVHDNTIPGLAISVRKNNQPYFQKGYGYANLEGQVLVDPQRTIFRIASISKPIAATALAVMVREGLLDLDASIYKYLPYFPRKEYDFTLRHLASHTAGIRGYRGREYGLDLPMDSRESLRIFQDDPLLFKPGSNYSYTSFGWVLISLAMEEVSGVSFADYVKKKVLEPFQMKDTFPEIPGEQPPQMAHFYTRYRAGFKKAIPVDNRYKLAGGGYVSTAVDVAKFGQQFLDTSLIEALNMQQFLTAEVIGSRETHYGLGWEINQDAWGRPTFGHIGKGVGGYAVLYVYPEEEMVFSLLVNCTNPGIQETLDMVVALLIGGLEK
ncbi:MULTISPECIES: serine hydrolase domain-containing protein [Arenibacter]|uniref:serine hydrolase domain-containing protein n=1 Tax=Arenibacter TaxID=178469 RepID=UPI000A37B3EB|nr:MULTISPECIES: serine hydrolase domain-containing protein [Arenibacter]